LFSFGYNGYGALGIGNFNLISGLVEILFFQNLEIEEICCGGGHSLILTSNRIFRNFSNYYKRK